MLSLSIVFFLLCILRSTVGVFSDVTDSKNSTEVSCQGPVSLQTYLALYALYNSTNGENWLFVPVIDTDDDDVRTDDANSVESATFSGNGSKWDFANVSSPLEGAQRPCRDGWYGLVCRNRTSTDSEDICIITSLLLEHQNLEGPIPNAVANLTDLEVLSFDNNVLTHTVPSILGSLVALQRLLLGFNHLDGDIPSELGRLSNCAQLQLSGNKFTGSLPTELFSLNSSVLHSFDVYRNHLTGTISSLLGNLTSLTVVNLHDNLLTGSIPSEIGYLQHTELLSLSDNFVTGTIPSELGRFSTLRLLYLTESYLTGSIPTEMGQLRAVESFGLNLNLLSSTIPTEMGRLFGCYELYLFANSLTGLIPSELGQLPVLGKLGLNQNMFTGPLPSEIKKLKYIKNLYVDDNMLTGSIADSVAADFNRMSIFNLGSNMFTSSLPFAQLANMTQMQQFIINTNYFTGSLRPIHSVRLILFQINDNYLTGSLDSIFPSNVQSVYPALVVLAFSDNGFSGSFPSSLFTLKVLHTLSGSSNCFSGHLTCSEEENKTVAIHPASRADKHLLSLATIDLNGLSSGRGCRHYILPKSIVPDGGYYPQNYIRGSIPSCFWSLPNLTALYLVGNGFTGSIQTVQSPSSTLIPSLLNLSLASNELTGVVPDFIQKHSFLQLDLSSNRFNGEIDKFNILNICSPQAFVDLSVNRLSGRLCSTQGCDWDSLSNNILQGNMFTFDTAHMTSQTQEAALSYYGSNTLNIAMAAASPVVFVVLCCLAGLIVVDTEWLLRQSLWYAMICSWQAQWKKVVLPVEWIATLNRSGAFMRWIVGSHFCFVTVVIVVLASLKAPNNSGYATYYHQYNWLISAAYLHGFWPVVILMTGIICGMVVVGSFFRTMRSGHHFRQLSNAAVAKEHSSVSRPFFQTDSIYFVSKIGAVLIVDLIIAALINVAYLVAVLDNNPNIQVIQIALSLFKLGWNRLFITGSLAWLNRNRQLSGFISPVMFRYSLTLCNFVLLPCIVTCLVDDSCFRELFAQQPAPLVYADTCDAYYGSGNGTLVCATEASSYQDVALKPPFIYSFQCSSALITNYVPVLLYSYLFSGLVMPVCLVVYMLVMSNRETPSARFGILHLLLPRVMRGQDLLMTIGDSEISGGSVDGAVKHGSTDSTGQSNDLIPCDSIVAIQLLNFTLFGTFGLAFPYLGVIIIFSAIIEMWVWMVAIGRHHLRFSEAIIRRSQQYSRSTVVAPTVYEDPDNMRSTKSAIPSTITSMRLSTLATLSKPTNAAGSRTVSAATEELNEIDSRASWDILLTFQSIPPLHLSHLIVIVAVIFIFWSALCFDMVADVYGTTKGLVTLFVVVLACPPLVYVLVWKLSGIFDVGVSITESGNPSDTQLGGSSVMNPIRLGPQSLSINSEFCAEL
jgi:Leucine-rich repeat (LRR) protein